MEINGKKVVDAVSKIKILITKRDTIEGNNKNPSSCAAARTVKRDVPGCISARVHLGRVYIEQEKKWVRYFTPESLRTEIVAFDRGGSFQSGEYELKPPSPAEKSNARKSYRERSDTNRSKPGNHPSKSPRKVRIAIIKRHNVAGVRPKGAVR